MAKRIHLVYKEYFVGGFLLLASLALLTLLLTTLAKNDLFADHYALKVIYPSKSDLSVGAKVKIRGMPVGLVTAIGFNSDNLIEITLKIESKYQAMIRDNSVASLIQERFPISDRIISITTGSAPYRVLEDGMILKAEEPLNLDAVMQKALKTFDDLSQIVDRLNRGQGTVGALLTRDDLYNDLRRITTSSGTAVQQANTLLFSLNTLSGKADRLLDTLQPAVIAGGEAATHLPEIVSSVQLLLDSVNILIGKINLLATDAAPLVLQGQGLLMDAGDVMGAAKRTWPLSSKVPQETEDPPLFIDPEVPGR